MRRLVVAVTLALGLAVVLSAQDYYRGTGGAGIFASVLSNGNVTALGYLVANTGVLPTTSSRSILVSPNDGAMGFTNNGGSTSITFKFDALPTVGSGFGTSPAVTANSTALAGSVNVGTGGSATSGVITFNGTAFPQAPFCTYSTQLTNGVTRGVPTTTQVTLTTTTAWTASDVVTWHCFSK